MIFVCDALPPPSPPPQTATVAINVGGSVGLQAEWNMSLNKLNIEIIVGPLSALLRIRCIYVAHAHEVCRSISMLHHILETPKIGNLLLFHTVWGMPRMRCLHTTYKFEVCQLLMFRLLPVSSAFMYIHLFSVQCTHRLKFRCKENNVHQWNAENWNIFRHWEPSYKVIPSAGIEW